LSGVILGFRRSGGTLGGDLIKTGGHRDGSHRLRDTERQRATLR